MSGVGHLHRQDSRAQRSSASTGIARDLLRGDLWIWPVAAAIGLGALYWAMSGALRSAEHRQVADQLRTILNADVESLTIWVKAQEVDAGLVVAATRLLAEPQRLQGLLQDSNAGALNLKCHAELREQLAPHLRRGGYAGYFLVSPQLRVIAADDNAAVGTQLDGGEGEFFRTVLGGKTAVSRPYRSPYMLVDERGERRAAVPTIFTAAPVRDGRGQVIAALGLRIQTRAFTKILQTARSGESGETFAFDRNGLLLSHSRFDADLKQVGLLADLPGSDSILTVELRDPQVNLTEGERPPLSRARQPLIPLVTDAAAGNSGSDVTGYRDYRGVPVVGAWTWLPEVDFGVATQIEVREAYRSLHIVRMAFWGLFLLLVLGAVVIFAFTVLVSRYGRRMGIAQLTLQQLGQYTLEERIGAGAMGSVYRARHAFLRRPTAVKVLHPHVSSEDARKRFEREVQLTSSLNHPNTIAIYDYGHTPEGVFYYAMEYLDGLDLETLVRRGGPLPDGRMIDILKQVCSSLAEAHSINLIHRDIKPGNLILSHRGGIPDYVKVLDFGLVKPIHAGADARLTQANVSVGTPHYMSPEAVERPDQVTPATDIYAVGAVGYFLLTGTTVFRGETSLEICMKQVRHEPDAPSRRLGKPVSASVEAAILHCLAKAPAARPTAMSLLDELSRCEPNQPWSRGEAEAWWAHYRRPGGPPAAGVRATHVE